MADSEKQDVTSKVAIDFCLLCLAALPSLILEITGKPFHRGFYCDDESISHPYKEDTVPIWSVAVAGFAVNFICMIMVELFIYLQQLRGFSMSDNTKLNITCCKTVFPHPYLVALYRSIGPFLFGAAISQGSTDIGKYSIGRLRPHFLAVCKPAWDTFNCTNAENLMLYIEQDVCTGDEHLIEEARLSHPSGHSSFSVYCAVYLVLYLQGRFKLRVSRLARPAIQAAAIYGALYVCLSRVSDYKHHWSDVLGGAVLGAAVAFVVKLFVPDWKIHDLVRIRVPKGYHMNSSPEPTESSRPESGYV